ncbi:MAG: hypothetical protein ABSG68_09545 [Thermoguttaceae bacterium]
MRPGQPISSRQLQSAYADVQRELACAGLWYVGNPLTRTEVVLCREAPPDLMDAAGFFVNEMHRLYRSFGCEPGHIYIPQWVGRPGARRNRGSLRDVLRHEFAHALAFYHPGPIRRTRAFVAAFDARYDEVWYDPPTDKEDFVTDYAMTAPDEDFAETFMVWLRGLAQTSGMGSRRCRYRSGRVTPALRAKFRFVHDVCRRLAR